MITYSPTQVRARLLQAVRLADATTGTFIPITPGQWGIVINAIETIIKTLCDDVGGDRLPIERITKPADIRRVVFGWLLHPIGAPLVPMSARDVPQAARSVLWDWVGPMKVNDQATGKTGYAMRPSFRDELAAVMDEAMGEWAKTIVG